MPAKNISKEEIIEHEPERSDLEIHFDNFRQALITYRNGDPNVGLVFLASLIDDMVLYDLTDQERKDIPTVEVLMRSLKEQFVERYKEIQRNHSSKDVRARKYMILDMNLHSQAIMEISEKLQRVIREREENVV
jgi:hypothetical protein